MSALLATGATCAWAEETPPYTVEVSDVAAKVGEHTVILAKLHLQPGHRVLLGYNNRVGQFSSFDNGVAFAEKVVHPTINDGALEFAVDVQPTKPGRHPINGVFRFCYTDGADTMLMVSVPLIASVTGTN